MGARTGEQFLERLRKTSRVVWLGNERVDDVTAHPALAGAAQNAGGRVRPPAPAMPTSA